MSSRSTLDGIMPDLIRYLNIQNLRPHLKKAGLLTDDEYARLEVSSNNTVQDAVEKLVGFLKRKGPEHVELLLRVLKESMKVDAHQGHVCIIQLLESRGIPSGDFLEGSPPPPHYGVHPQLSATDSGICRDSPYTESTTSSSPHKEHHMNRASSGLHQSISSSSSSSPQEYHIGTHMYRASNGLHQSISSSSSSSPHEYHIGAHMYRASNGLHQSISSSSSSSPHEYHIGTHMYRASNGYHHIGNGYHHLPQQGGIRNGHHYLSAWEEDIGNGFHRLGIRDDIPRLESNAPLELGRFDQIEGSSKNKREIEKLRYKVIRDSENITMKFATLVLAIYRLLSRNHIPLEEVRLALLYLGCHRNKPAGQNVSMFSNTTSDISQAPDLAALIQGLHNYSSWFNYRLLKYVATQFGGEEGKTLITEYEDDLRGYFENLIAYQCPQFSLTKGIPQGYEQLDVKVEWDYRTCTAQDVAHFQATLSDVLNLEPYVFQLKSIEEGCVLFTWAVPATVALHILTETLSHKSMLKEWLVVYVRILGRCIDVQSPKKWHPIEEPVPCPIEEEPEEHTRVLKHSSSAGSGGSSTSTVCSSLSQMTLTNSKCGSSPGKRSSHHSQSDLESDLPITVVEAEILSIYSGVSGNGSCASSPTSKRLSQESQHLSDDNCPSPSHSDADKHSYTEPGHHLLCEQSRPYHSESNLLAASPTLKLLTQREVRAMSEIALYTEVSSPCSPCRKETTKSKSKKRFIRSPAKWLPRLFWPFRRRRQNSAVQPQEPTPPAFPILDLTEEPHTGSGPHYFLTEQEQQQQIKEPPSPVTALLSVPHVVIPSPSYGRVGSDTSSKTVHASELFSQQSFSQDSETQADMFLPVPSEGSNRSQSPISLSSSSRYIHTPPLLTQLSEENEMEIEYNVTIKHAIRTRANSAPHKLSYGVRHKSSFTRTRDDLHTHHRRYPSANAADYRVSSPISSSSSRCPSSRTSGYFTNSQSDISSLIVTPDSPTSQANSEFSFQGNDVPVQPSGSFPSRIPVRRHSLNARSRNSTQPSPLVKSQSTHSHAFSFDATEAF